MTGGHPSSQQQSWALVWACQALMLSILQSSLHQNQDQQQEGEGPQQTLLEVTFKEGSKERRPGARGGWHCVEGRTCQPQRTFWGVYLLLFFAQKNL